MSTNNNNGIIHNNGNNVTNASPRITTFKTLENNEKNPKKEERNMNSNHSSQHNHFSHAHHPSREILKQRSVSTTTSITSTYSSQTDLPRLPIPSLEDTISKFLQSVSVFETEDQRAETKRIADDFLKGDGAKLQKLLEEYEEEGEATGMFGSYVEEFWDEAYLAPDTSVVLNLNPFFLFEDGPDPKTSKDQIGRAASLTFATCKFASLLKQEKLTPDTFRGKSLCMDQFKSLFGACRMPMSNNHDYVQVDPDSTHIAVLKNHQIYYFQALYPDGTVAVDETDIKDILHAIRNESNNVDVISSATKAIGVLSTQDRNCWACARQALIDGDEHNAAALAIVDSALFILTLDDYVPSSVHDAASNMLHGTYALTTGKSGGSVSSGENNGNGSLIEYQAGTCINRWYDKLQLIVCADGTAGLNFEHSAVDGHTALRLASDVFAETVIEFAKTITRSVHGVEHSDRFVPGVLSDAVVERAAEISSKKENGNKIILDIDTRPKKLHFHLTPDVADRIFFAETALGDQIVASDTYVLEFKDYGKTLITKNKMSPDAFVQLTILLAYYRLYGKIVSVYESVLTKCFFHGRTEAMRTATPEALAFCETFCSRFTSKEEKLQALRLATSTHSKLVKEAAAGKGIDRHLYALKCLAKRHFSTVPEFFTSRAYAELNHTVLSTSNCGNPSLRLFGFGPVVPDGFGIGYIIRDYDIQYSVSSKHRQTKRFVNMLHQTLYQIGTVLLTPLNLVEVEQRRRCTKLPHAQREEDEMKESQMQYMDVFEIFGEGVVVGTPSESKLKKGKPKKEEKMMARVVRRMNSIGSEVLDTIGEDITTKRRPSLERKTRRPSKDKELKEYLLNDDGFAFFA